MGFHCGIVGLPNVGKSTIFNALTSAGAEAANFPFCTIEPNKGIVAVPDPRLDKIAELIPPEKKIPASMTFVDIAGIVKGASKGEGLGNQFLAHIREANAIAHVVRCFRDSDVVHVEGSVDPIRDIEVIETELILADLESAEKKLSSSQKISKSGDKKAKALAGILSIIVEALNSGKSVRSIGLDEGQLSLVQDLHFITAKKMMYIANVSEDDLSDPEQNENLSKLKAHAKSEGSSVVEICGKIESEIAELSDEEKIEFLKDMGMSEPGLNRVIRAGYELLGLKTYFTAGEKEVRAWTYQDGWKAPQAAGVIHSDFERGFIRAEVYKYDDLVSHQSVNSIKDAGLLKVEGKEYVVQDGDVMHFRFNV